MAKVIILSRFFPAYHIRKGEPTYFAEKLLNMLDLNYEGGDYKKILSSLNPAKKDICKEFLNSLSNTDEIKGHTIRAGNRFKAGDKASLRVWSGKPYRSKQIIIAPETEIKKVWDFKIMGGNVFLPPHEYLDDELLTRIAQNDGLTLTDFVSWFKNFSEYFDGQVICFNENINY